MTIKGGVSKVNDIEFFSNGVKKRSIILYTRESKSRKFEVHFYNENIDQLEKLSYGDSVTIRFTLDSEVFKDKSGESYFTHIIGLEILEYKRFY